MAPSQLAQLKSALSTAGLNRNSQPKSKSKSNNKAGLTNKDREKKEKRLEDIRASLNKFDVREAKVKNPVLGKGPKNKGVTGTPSQSRSRGLEIRKQSLLPEHELRRSGHTGTFLDRRFGESNPTITPEERALERFTRARESERVSRSGRRAVFNLNDEDEGGLGFGDDHDDDEGNGNGGALGKKSSGFTLTHGGRAVNDLRGDDFLTQGLGDDEDELQDDFGFVKRGADEVDGLERGPLKRSFGDGEGGDDQPERKKTKAEIMNEVIAKSKSYKYERQQQKELDEDLRLQLDEDIDGLRDLLAASAPKKVGRSMEESTGTNLTPLGITTRVVVPTEQTEPKREMSKAEAALPNAEDGMDYDQYVRSLAFDRRSKPKDRIKTEEESALEEKEKLESAEKARLRRMRGDVGADDDADEEEGSGRKRRKGKGKGKDKDSEGIKRAPEADDLDDDFVDDYEGGAGEFGIGGGLGVEGDEAMSGSDEDEDEEEEDDEDEDEDDESGEDEDDEEWEDEGSDLQDDEDMDSTIKGSSKTTKPKSQSSKSSKPIKKEIPFTFDCPSTHDDLLEIMDDLKEADVEIVIKRIRAIYHPSLGEGNKDKLQELLGVLLEHCVYLGATSNTSFRTAGLLFPHINALVQINVVSAAEQFKTILSSMESSFRENLSKGDMLDSKSFPRASELIILRLIGIVWSTSDLSNPISAPAQLLMGQYLTQCRVRSLADVGSGLFLCSLFLQYESFSKRVIPEVVNFLSLACVILAPKACDFTSYPGLFPVGQLAKIPVEAMRIRPKASASLKVVQADLGDFLAVEEEDQRDAHQIKVNMLAMAVQLVGKMAEFQAGLPAFIEIVEPLQQVLGILRAAALPASLKTVVERQEASLVRRLKFARQSRVPLQIQTHRPIPIPTYAPKFEADFSMDKRYDPDAERNAANKLKAMYKKERKGAIRELRKDNKFLAQHRADERKAKDASYEQKMRRVHGDIATNERAEEKAMEREKNRIERRAGRK